MVKKREANFTPKEEDCLLQICRKYSSVINSKQSDSVMCLKKRCTWAIVQEEFCTLTGTERSLKTLKSKFENMKKRQKKKMRQFGGCVYSKEDESCQTLNFSSNEETLITVIKNEVEKGEPISGEPSVESHLPCTSQLKPEATEEGNKDCIQNGTPEEIPDSHRSSFLLPDPEISITRKRRSPFEDEPLHRKNVFCINRENNEAEIHEKKIAQFQMDAEQHEWKRIEHEWKRIEHEMAVENEALKAKLFKLKIKKLEKELSYS